MGVTQTDKYLPGHNAIASLLKALAHPARVAIVEYLLQQKSCICTDITEVLPLAQSTVSQHLKELKQAGVIQGTIEGTSVCYCINTNTMQLIYDYFKRLRQLTSDGQTTM